MGDKRDVFISYARRSEDEARRIAELLRDLNGAGIELRDLQTTQSSLEDIFVDLVRSRG